MGRISQQRCYNCRTLDEFLSVLPQEILPVKNLYERVKGRKIEIYEGQVVHAKIDERKRVIESVKSLFDHSYLLDLFRHLLERFSSSFGSKPQDDEIDEDDWQAVLAAIFLREKIEHLPFYHQEQLMELVSNLRHDIEEAPNRDNNYRNRR